MREIILDTETTGFRPGPGGPDRRDRLRRGSSRISPPAKTFHVYVNPERDMPESAFNVHGLSEEFLSDKPVFAELAENFLSFIGDAPLVIHNAEFDMKFLNSELKKIGRPILPRDRAIDTVAMARRKFPGAQANLDALCRRFDIDLSRRDKHGALLDAELLAEVYLQLMRRIAARPRAQRQSRPRSDSPVAGPAAGPRAARPCAQPGRAGGSCGAG